jgi:hypothetical protein
VPTKSPRIADAHLVFALAFMIGLGELDADLKVVAANSASDWQPNQTVGWNGVSLEKPA